VHRPFTPEEITSIQELTKIGTDKLRDKLIKAKELINQIEEELYSTDFETHQNAMWYGVNIIHFIDDFFNGMRS
jgi:hypothetical protein